MTGRRATVVAVSALTGSSVRGSIDGRDLLAVALPALLVMTDFEREAFVDYYVAGDSDPAIAARIGVCRQRVQQLRRQARSRISAVLEPLAEVA